MKKKEKEKGQFRGTPFQKHSDSQQTRAERKRSGIFSAPEGERRGPFYAPRQLTEEEKKERMLKKKLNQAELEEMLKTKNYDKPTKTIASILGKLNFSVAKLYLWRFQLFNSAIVEGVGLLMYYAFLPMFLLITVPWVAITMVVPISFLSKFIIYKIWMFKKVDTNENLRSNST